MKVSDLMKCALPGQQVVIYVPDWDDGFECNEFKSLLYMGEYEDTPDTWDDRDVCVIQTRPDDRLLIGLVHA